MDKSGNAVAESPSVLRKRTNFSGQQLKNFPEWTSTHGIPQIGRSRSYFCLGFWSLLTLAALGLLIWQIVLIFKEYFRYDVAVQIQLEFQERTFPAVTVCDMNPYKKSVAKTMPRIQRLVDTYYYTMEKLSCSTYPHCSLETNSTMETDAEMYGLNDINDTMALQTKVKRLLILEAAQYNMSNAEANATDFMQGCSFNSNDCVADDWSVLYDPNMGRCFVYNYYGEQNATRAGPIYGLRVIFKTNISEYILPSDTAGMRVLVHDQNDYPFPDVFGYNIQVGTATSIGVTFEQVSRLGSPYGECTDTKPDGYLYPLAYSTEGCQRSLLQNSTVTQCGCYDPSFMQPNGTTNVCVIPDDYNCWNDETNSTAAENGCTQPCNEGTYQVTVSTAQWPSKMLTAVADCYEGQYSQSCNEVFSQNGALLEVFFEKLNYETMTESAAYTVSNLLSDFGGQIGLWLGMSVISVVEFMVLFFQVCVGCCSPKVGEIVALQ